MSSYSRACESHTMKSLFVLILCFFCTANALNTEMAEKILKTIRKCSKQHHLKFEDIQGALRHGQLPTSPEGKCLVACSLKEFGLLKDNKFDLEGSYNLNKMRFTDSEALNRANEISKQCEVDVAGGEYANECDLGIAIANCGLQNSRKVGIISSDLW